MILIYYIIGIAVLFGIVVVIGEYGGPVLDRSAQNKGIKYIEKLGYEVKKSTVTSNHYGLYFIKDGKKYFAKYQCNPFGKIRWKNGSPEEVVMKKNKPGKPGSAGNVA